MKLLRLSIAAKLYALFSLIAIITVSLAMFAVVNARRQAALADEFHFAFIGAQNVERVNSLIYAVVMESRGIYMSPDVRTAQKYGAGLLKFNDDIGAVVKGWQQTVRTDDASQFEAFSKRVQEFQQFR